MYWFFTVHSTGELHFLVLCPLKSFLQIRMLACYCDALPSTRKELLRGLGLVGQSSPLYFSSPSVKACQNQCCLVKISKREEAPAEGVCS